MLKKKQTKQEKVFFSLIVGIFLSLFLIGGVSAAIDYSVTTLGIVEVLKIFIIFSGLFIIAMTFKSFHQGEITFGRLFRIGVIVALAVGVILLLAPVLINYISDLIK